MSLLRTSIAVAGLAMLLAAGAPTPSATAASENPCAATNPCAAKPKTANPCAGQATNPCAAKAANPCAAKPETTNPCAAHADDGHSMSDHEAPAATVRKKSKSY